MPRTERIDTPAYDPDGVVLAVDTGRWVGMATTSLHRGEDYAFSEVTDVLRSHGQGISVAVTLQAVAFARSRGVRWLRTFHHPGNTSAIGMNRRLGFVDEDRERWRS